MVSIASPAIRWTGHTTSSHPASGCTPTQAASTGGREWPRAEPGPFNVGDDNAQVISDVLWVPRHGGEPARLCSSPGSARGVWMSEQGPRGRSGGRPAGRCRGGGLGWPSRRANWAPSTCWAPGRSSWRITQFAGAPQAQRINRVPKNSRQSPYGSVRVRPRHRGAPGRGGQGRARRCGRLGRQRVQRGPGLLQGDQVGGELALDWDPVNDEENADTHHTFADDPTWIGLGVHADVQPCRYVDGDLGLELWIGCDGGIYRSRRPVRRMRETGDVHPSEQRA